MSVAWFDGVTFTVEVAFSTAPLAVTPTWTDISAYVIAVPRIASGRSSEFSKFAPSSCEITLKNIDRRFDPEYSSGPYFGNLLPGKKIRVRVTYSATTYDQFTGFVQGWPQTYIDALDSNVTIQAIDGSRFLEQADLPGSSYAQEVLADSPLHYWPMQESPGATHADSVSTLNISTIGTELSTSLSAPLGEPAGVSTEILDAAVGTVSVMGASPFIAAQPTALEFWMYFPSVAAATIGRSPRVFMCSSVSAYSVMYLQCDDVASGGLMKAVYYNGADNETATTTGVSIPVGLHHIVVRADGTNLYLYIDANIVSTAALSGGSLGVSSSAGVSVSTFTSDATQSAYISHIAVYGGTAPTAARFQAHYLAGLTAYGHPYGERSGARIGRALDAMSWPAADRDLATGDTVHGPYLPAGQSAMTYLRDVETAEDGLVFLDGRGYVTLRDRNWQWTRALSATFSDDGTDTDYADITVDANTIDVVRNKVSATYGPNDAYLFSEDTTSRTAYGPATEPLSVPTIDSANTARGLTQYKLRAMKDPQTRITELVTYPREVPATMFPVVLNLKIGDRINCEVRPQNLGSAIVKTLTVQGIEHGWDADTWMTRLYLSPAPASYTASPYLTLGDATYGQIGATAGNKIPF